MSRSSFDACFNFILFMVLAISLSKAQAQEAAKPLREEPAIVDARVGFSGDYKLGCWTPIEIDLLGGTKPFTGQVVVTVPDSDGVPTSISNAEDRPVGILPGQLSTARLFIRVGQSNSPIQVRFFADGKLLAERKFYAGPEPGEGIVLGGRPATTRLLLEFGPSLNLKDLFLDTKISSELLRTKVAHIEGAESFPLDKIGYEAIDTVVLNTSTPEIYRPLIQNPGRLEALKQWVELGGRVIVMGSANSEELLRAGGPLADFLPGKFDSFERLRQSYPLETFSGEEKLITENRRLDLQIPKLSEVRGQILVHAGSQPTDLPIVVRARLGLGEIVFVGVNLNQEPLAKWAGRQAFLRKVLDWDEESFELEQLDQSLHNADSADMTGRVRNALDSKFQGVEVVSFALVAFLVLGYIVLIGPGDYFLVRKVFGKPEMTWITFPIFVVAVSVAAYFYARWTKGDQLRVNQVEVVDVDTTSGLIRGNVWTHFFTPQVEEYNLNLQPKILVNKSLENSSTEISWLGLPGYSLGGMQASATQTSVFKKGYSFSPNRDAMLGLPVQVWSTKTISGVWTAQTESVPVASELQPTTDNLLLGHITNSTGTELQDCLLLYRRWAYYIGPFGDGKSITIDHSRQPRTLGTMLTSATAGDETIHDTVDDGTVPFHRASSDITRLLKSMMFFKAINGQSYTGSLNRYQKHLDLSHLLHQDECAILFAKHNQQGSQWLDDGNAMASDEDRHWTYYRFILPVEKPSPEE